MQNVEYKAELRDIDLARTIAAALRVPYVMTSQQVDTYYRIPDARLKKRQIEGSLVEFIFYSRINRIRPKLSQFTIYSEHQARERFGAELPPVWKVVKKIREIYMSDGVRVHLDTVDGLGGFIEFEALVCPERNLARCHEAIDKLRKAFAPAMGEAIACSYVDLIAQDDELKTTTPAG